MALLLVLEELELAEVVEDSVFTVILIVVRSQPSPHASNNRIVCKTSLSEEHVPSISILSVKDVGELDGLCKSVSEPETAPFVVEPLKRLASKNFDWYGSAKIDSYILVSTISTHDRLSTFGIRVARQSRKIILLSFDKSIKSVVVCCFLGGKRKLIVVTIDNINVNTYGLSPFS